MTEFKDVLIENTNPEKSEPSIVDDFMYGSNVASSHVTIRMGFLRKVYGLLTVQLLITTIIAVLFMAVPAINDFFRTQPWIIMLSAFSSIGLIIALSIYAHQYPKNYYLLLAFTICESLMVGSIVTHYSAWSVIEAFLLTFVVTCSLTLMTFQSKKDFSAWGTGLFAALWIFLLVSMLQIFFPVELAARVMAGVGAFLFSLFIIFDTHMIMKRLSPEEYILATVNLYMDIINLFLHILRAIGSQRN